MRDWLFFWPRQRRYQLQVFSAKGAWRPNGNLRHVAAFLPLNRTCIFCQMRPVSVGYCLPMTAEEESSVRQR